DGDFASTVQDDVTVQASQLPGRGLKRKHAHALHPSRQKGEVPDIRPDVEKLPTARQALHQDFHDDWSVRPAGDQLAIEPASGVELELDAVHLIDGESQRAPDEPSKGILAAPKWKMLLEKRVRGEDGLFHVAPPRHEDHSSCQRGDQVGNGGGAKSTD